MCKRAAYASLSAIFASIFLFVSFHLNVAPAHAGSPYRADTLKTDEHGGRRITPQQVFALLREDTAGPRLLYRSGGSFVEWFRDDVRVLAVLPYRRSGETHMGVFVVDIASRAQLLLGDGTQARLSPDNNYVALLAADGSIKISHVQSAQAKLVASLQPKFAVSIDGLSWSPDSRFLAFSCQVRGAHSGDVHNAIYAFNISDQRPRELFETQIDLEGVSWTSKGVLAAIRQIKYETHKPSEIWGKAVLIDPSTRRVRPVISNDGFSLRFLSAVLSPDGKKIAYGHDEFPQAAPTTLFMRPAVRFLDSGRTKLYRLVRPYALVEMAPRWLSDSRHVAYRCKSAALFSSICAIDLESGEVRRFDLDPLRDISDFAVSVTTGRFAILSENAVGAVYLTIFDPAQHTGFDAYSANRFDLDGFALGTVRPFSWVSFDGVRFGGLLVLPINYIPGTRYPLVVDLHGGPDRGIQLMSALTGRAPIDWQMWAGMGYAVLVADYRKSGVVGLNPEFHHRTRGHLEDDDADDVLAAIAQVVKIGVADPSRIAAIGHSYGATVLDWLTTRSRVLTAAVVHEGLPSMTMQADQLPDYEKVDVIRSELRWFLGAGNGDLRKTERDNEPLTYASNVKTPVLWVASRPDMTRTHSIAEFYVSKINASGGCARFLQFSGEQHYFTKQENIDRMIDSAVIWINYWFSRSRSNSSSPQSEGKQRKACPYSLNLFGSP